MSWSRARALIRRTIAVGGVVVVFGAAGAGTGVAAGRTPAAPPSAAPAAAVSVPAPVTASVDKSLKQNGMSRSGALSAYWTADRMARAVQIKTTTPSRATLERQLAEARTEAARPSTPHAVAPAGATAPRPLVAASTTVGKVFFRNATNGLDYVCSGAAVNSASLRLVSTAGHCVHGGAGGTWHQNWVFVPLYNFGNTPFGIWSASWLVTFNGWMTSSNFTFDVGFVKVFDNPGPIVNAVGGNGIQTGQAKSRFMTILGYPAEPPYDGQWQYFCTGTTSQSSIFDPNRIKMPCPLTPGVSGGPWLWAYSDATGLGYVNGTTSTTNGGRTTLWSPYFDDADWNLYLYADSL